MIFISIPTFFLGIQKEPCEKSGFQTFAFRSKSSTYRPSSFKPRVPRAVFLSRGSGALDHKRGARVGLPESVPKTRFRPKATGGFKKNNILAEHEANALRTFLSLVSTNPRFSFLPSRKSLREDRTSRDLPFPSFPHPLHTTADSSGCGMSSLGLRNGIVVAVSLNPAASTSFVDPGLNKLASEIAVRKYVAILSGIVRLSSTSSFPSHPSFPSMNVADMHHSSFPFVGSRA